MRVVKAEGPLYRSQLPLYLWWNAWPLDQGWCGMPWMILRQKATQRFTILELNKLWWPQSCIKEKLLLINKMVSRKNMVASMIACKSNDWVTEESAITVRINGTTVFIICQSAIRLSLAICDFRSKSTLRTGRERGMRVAELFNWPRHFGFATETGLVRSYRNLLSRVESFGLANTAAWTYRASSGQNPVRNLTTSLETELRKRVVAENQLRVTQAKKHSQELRSGSGPITEALEGQRHKSDHAVMALGSRSWKHWAWSASEPVRWYSDNWQS